MGDHDMKTFCTAAALGLALASCSPGATARQPPAPTPSAAASAAAKAPAAFVPTDFEVPTRIEGEGFVLVPLGPDLAQIDYAAYMSSIEHLQATFTRSTGWPRAELDADDAMADMLTEQGRFERRESFAYAVLTPDGTRERGCVYVQPGVGEYDAVVRLWVTKAEYDAGFDAELYAWAQDWVAREWPFSKVAWPGRAIGWEEWDALVAAEEKTAS
jgi:hypothetical protein